MAVCDADDPIATSQNIPMALLYMTNWLFIMTIYIPCMIVIGRAPLWENASYKLMFAVGLYDMTQIFINCFMSSVFSFMAASYCTNQMAMFITGHIVHGK
jgi:hypothetical protein